MFDLSFFWKERGKKKDFVSKGKEKGKEEAPISL